MAHILSPMRALTRRSLHPFVTAGLLCMLVWQTALATTPAPVIPLPAAIAVPAPAKMDFEVKGKISGFGYSAKAELLWHHDGAHYAARQAIRAPIVGTRWQTSEGRIAATHLAPQKFVDSSRKRRNIEFNPDQGTASATESGAPLVAPAGSQDRLSVFFQLAATVAADPSVRAVGRQIPIWTVATNRQEFWVFEVQEIAPIALPAGELPAIQLQRMPRKPDDQLAEIWLSPETGYLPVRIHFEDDGDVVDLRLIRYTPQDSSGD